MNRIPLALGLVAAVGLLAAFACDQEPAPSSVSPAPVAPPTPQTPTPPTPPAPAPIVDPAPRPADPGQDTAAVRGRILFDGDAPRRARVRMDANPDCAALHGDERVLNEEVIVDEGADGKTLRNVVVYIKRGLEGRQFPAPSEAAEIDQHGCLYTPHVTAVMAGQTIRVKNSDAFLHNIHFKPRNNPEQNFGQASVGAQNEVVFRNPEVAIEVGCDVHAWMKSWVAVLPNPKFAVIGEAGTFSIEGLPAGTYTIAAWHEKYGEQTQEVTVAAGETKALDFTFREP